MNIVEQKELTPLVAAAVEQAWKAGCPIAEDADKIVPVALRRWQSSRRRGIDADNYQAHVRDLAKGLIQSLEAEPCLVGSLKKDYEYLASTIADKLLRAEQ